MLALASAAGVLVLVLASRGPVVVVLPLLLFVTAVAPAIGLARSLGAGLAPEARAALTLLLAPVVASVLFVGVRLATHGVTLALPILVVLFGLVALLPGVRPTIAPVVPPVPKFSRIAWAPVVAAGWLACAHLASSALAWRSDGAFHAGVVQSMLHTWPPEDPFLAGLPLRYFWGWHAWAALAASAMPQLPVTVLLAASSVLALAAALFAVSALAAECGADARGRAWAMILLLVGAAPFAWVMLAGHALVGETRGVAELAPVLAHGGDLALRALDPGFLHPSLVLPLDKFVVVTPFAWGLVGALVLVLLLRRSLEAYDARSALGVAITAAAVVFLHPAAGGLLGGASAVAVLASALAGRVSWRAAGGTLIALACGALALLPYSALLAPSAEGGATAWRFGLDARGALSVVWGGAVLLPLAWLTLRRGGSLVSALLGVMLAALLVPALVLRAGGDNQSKALNLAFALAAAPAAVALAGWATTRGRRVMSVALAVCAWAPTLVAILFAYAHEDGASADAPYSPGAAMVRAVAREMPREAVLVDATLDPTRDAAPLVPGATGRAMLWSGAFMAGKWGHPHAALEARAAAATALAEGRWPEGPAGELLDALAREVWVIVPDDAAHGGAEADVVARADGRLLVRMRRP